MSVHPFSTTGIEGDQAMASRRAFLAAGAGVAAMPVLRGQAADGPAGAGRELYELRTYKVDSGQQQGLEAWLAEAAVPAWNRIGIPKVGVFVPRDAAGSVIVLLVHESAESLVTATSRLLADAEYQAKGATLIDAPADAPAFARVESSLLLAFAGMPKLEVPASAKGADRVFQLRVYESPSTKTNQKKIEMFNEAGEIAIFRKVGLNPVFFGEALVGAKLPNLTYMLGFENQAALDAGWKAFGEDPGWKALKAKSEYADKAILSGITNTVLRPLGASQI
jgi:hypothetical protein